MAPPSATGLDTHESVNTQAIEADINQDGTKHKLVIPNEMPLPKPHIKSEDPYKEREYQKGRLALAFRIFAKLGFDEGVAGHITYRDPVEPTSFWVNPFGVAWSLLKASDLIRVDHTGAVVEGGECRMLNTAAFMIHHAAHTARPEVNCVAHSHTIYGRTFSAMGRTLDMITQDSCSFYNDLALYTSFNGIVLDEEEGIEIAQALGKKKAALLQNHGILTCGETIEACVFWFMSLEKCCHTQLMADAAAGGRGHPIVTIPDEEAARVRDIIGFDLAGVFSAKPVFDLMAHTSGDDYKN